MSIVTSNLKSFSENPGLFDVSWANRVLKLAIHECYNRDRVWSARILEISYCVKNLKEHGYWWQAEILGHHLNRCFYARARATPSTTGRRDS